MKALHIARYGRFPKLLQNLDIPRPKSNQFLIKMVAAPFNPSDINFFQGNYGIRKQNFPISGFQGSGQIIEVGDKANNDCIGQIVSVLSNENNGTHASHISVSRQNLIFWPDKLQLKNISQVKSLATQWINPVSCIGMENIIKREHFGTVVLSAATSQLSKMMVKYIKKKNPQIKIIGFSRSDRFDNELKNMGMTQIHRIQDKEVYKALKNNNKTVFLDCIGGQFAADVFNNLPANSCMVCYGRLSKQPMGSLDLKQIFFGNKRVEGFWMNTLLDSISADELNSIKQKVVQNHNTIFKSQIRKAYPIDQFMEAIKESVKNASDGKILIDLLGQQKLPI